MSSFTSRAPPPQQQPQKNTTHEANVGEISCLEEKNQLVYISNPIYEDEESKESGLELDTPFETPKSSPSHLEKSDSSCDDDDDGEIQVEVGVDSPCYTPPLTPMKKLDAEACSVSLVRSLGTTNGSDSIISRSVNGLSSSSSVSVSTSPSW
ncbi:hypothetical protein TSUD_141120 [Trifolium subterraneum]|uniref:Uncharacterized protein n=1 Tax=Trifolium subterraneum TaxID=3900 RepID=A0A2Z6NX81_TRISU|nr:hypothetical protein TSUD_141120 [Trifolium subterraneum]